MTSRPAKSLIDFAFNAAYRRFDSFVMPVYMPDVPKPVRHTVAERAEGRYLPARGFNCLTPLNDALAGLAPALTPAEQLQLVARMSFGWLRWEPFSLYPMHGGIPSPRSFFLCDLLIALADRSGQCDRLYRYCPEHDALIPEGYLEGDARLCAGGNLVFIVAANLERIAPLYGDLSAHLVALECGHAARQLVFMCHAVGWSAGICGTVHNSSASNSSFWRNRRDLPLSVVVTDACADVLTEWATSLPSQTLSLVRHEADLHAFKGLSDFLSAWRCSPGLNDPLDPPHAIPDAAGDRRLWPDDDVLEIVRRRSSGPDYIGYNFAGEPLDQNADARFLAVLSRLRQMARVRDLDRLDWSLHSLDLRIAGRDQTVGELDLTGAGKPRVVVPDLMEQFGSWLGNRGRGRVSSAHRVIVFTVDLAQALYEYGVDGIMMANIGAGIVAQEICIAASAVHLSARPMRGFDELKAEMLLRDGRQATYVIMVASGRDAILAFETEGAGMP